MRVALFARRSPKASAPLSPKAICTIRERVAHPSPPRYCNNALTVPYVKSGRNIYDVRTMGDFKDDMAAVSEFVSSERISKALDARSQPFNACNMDVYLRFLDDWMKE